MNIFGHEVTPESTKPTAAEEKAVNDAYQLMRSGSVKAARDILFQTFSPGPAEKHFALIQLRLGTPPEPVVPKQTHAPQQMHVQKQVYAPAPQWRIPPLLKIAVAAGLVWSALAPRRD